jgi:histidine triad (HIT) family protein
MSEDNVFAKIIRGEIPAEKVYETNELVAIRDINPVAPEHVLVLPKRAIHNVAAAKDTDRQLLGDLLLAGAEVARQLGIEDTGYRLVLNVGRHGGESVPHLHLHVIGGRQLQWPPG